MEKDLFRLHCFMGVDEMLEMQPLELSREFKPLEGTKDETEECMQVEL